jgi:hypothetical protein
LREIASLAEEVEDRGLSRRRRIAIMQERLDALDQKAAELARLSAYVRAKIAWMEAGQRGPEPEPAGLASGFAGLVDEVAAAGKKAGRRRKIAAR